MFVADLLCHESLKPDALAHSKMAEDKFYIRHIFLFVFLINCKTLLARTKHNKMHDTDSLPSHSPSVTGENMTLYLSHHHLSSKRAH